jgi:hypothetical protein
VPGTPAGEVVAGAGAVRGERQRSCSCGFVTAVEQAPPASSNPAVDLDGHGRFGIEVLHPVRRAAAADEQVEGVAVGCLPDLDAVRPPGASPRRRQVAVVVTGLTLGTVRI